MGSSIKCSKQYSLNFFSKENFPKLRSITVDDLTTLLEEKKKDNSVSANVSETKWNDVVKNLVSESNINFKVQHETYLKKIFNVARMLSNGKARKYILVLLLFPFLKHNKDSVSKFYYINKSLHNGNLTFSNFRFFIMYYIENITRGISVLLSDIASISGKYDFESYQKECCNILNVKKFYYSVFNSFYDDVNYKYAQGQIANTCNYQVTEDDFENIFNSNSSFFCFEEFNIKFSEFVESLKTIKQ